MISYNLSFKIKLSNDWIWLVINELLANSILLSIKPQKRSINDLLGIFSILSNSTGFAVEPKDELYHLNLFIIVLYILLNLWNNFQAHGCPLWLSAMSCLMSRDNHSQSWPHTLPQPNKMAAISQTMFSKKHFQRKVLYFDSNFTIVDSYRFNWQYGSVGSGNGLAPNQWQAIILTNDGTVHWRIYAIIGRYDLRWII